MNPYTPLFDNIAAQHGTVTAVVYGYIWRCCQMERGVCDASPSTIGTKIGSSRRTVIDHIDKLIAAGLVVDLTPDIKGKPHKLLVQDLHTTYAESAQVPMQKSHNTCADSAHKDTYTKGNKEETDPIIELAEYFEEKSGCYKPRTYTRNKWLDPLVELYKLSDGDFGKTKILIKDCVDLLVGNNYTVSTPASLLNTAKTMKSGQVNGKVNGNGRIHEPDEAGAAFEVAWNCAGRGRLDTEDEIIKQAARTFGFARLRQWDVNFKSTAQKEFIGIYNDIKRKTTTAA